MIGNWETDAPLGQGRLQEHGRILKAFTTGLEAVPEVRVRDMTVWVEGVEWRWRAIRVEQFQ